MRGGNLLKVCAVIVSLTIFASIVYVGFGEHAPTMVPQDPTVTVTSTDGTDTGEPTAEATGLHIAPQVWNRNARSNGNVVVFVNPANLWGTPREEILAAWWCWAIDPRPPWCDIWTCEPIPGDLPDPWCPDDAKNIELEDGEEGILLKFSRSPLMKLSGEEYGEVEVSIMALLNDGSIVEGKGTVRIIDPPEQK
ncbi:MAG: hypothetical protein JSV43_02335 [Methanobacteriota archaeon]|nr:MAG: hypothetical protein JSV43_02335 [Euryarchaeota archaeon]